MIFTFFITEFSFLFLNLLKKSDSSDDIQQNNANKIFENTNLDSKFYKTIISLKENLLVENINFRTDKFGSIIPSNIDSLNENDNYILFCGGSTTESSQVDEGIRTTEKFTMLSGIKSVNFGKSGRSLRGCIQTINNVLYSIDNKKISIKRPKLYVIATNFNTLSDFFRNKLIQNKDEFSYKKPFGTNTFFLVKNIYKKYLRDKFFNIKLSNYEHSILDGCCFAPSNINRSNQLPKILKWDDQNNFSEYGNYLRIEIDNLNMLLSKYSINSSRVVFIIEPNSLGINYENQYRDYWLGKDGRQFLYSYDGSILNGRDSAYILNKFDEVYSTLFRNSGFKVLTPDPDEFPKWSFYDSVHYTDYGTDYMATFYKKNLTDLFNLR